MVLQILPLRQSQISSNQRRLFLGPSERQSLEDGAAAQTEQSAADLAECASGSSVVSSPLSRRRRLAEAIAERIWSVAPPIDHNWLKGAYGPVEGPALEEANARYRVTPRSNWSTGIDNSQGAVSRFVARADRDSDKRLATTARSGANWSGGDIEHGRARWIGMATMHSQSRSMKSVADPRYIGKPIGCRPFPVHGFMARVATAQALGRRIGSSTPSSFRPEASCVVDLEPVSLTVESRPR